MKCDHKYDSLLKYGGYAKCIKCQKTAGQIVQEGLKEVFGR